MRKHPLLWSLMLVLGLSSTALAQSNPTSRDSISRRLARQDSVETARQERVNAITLTDQPTRDSLDRSLTKMASSTPAPTPATTGAVYPNAGGRYIYDTGNIVDVLRHSQSDITAVCAHRGYFRENGVPENSLRAIQRAFDQNIELIELDIKMSKDGVPVLSHDFNLGRVTVGGKYNPVSSYTSGQLQQFLLKDKDGNNTQDHLPTFEQAIDYIHDHRIAIVVALDLKDRAAIRACWDIVRRKQNAWYNPAYNWVIFKVNATVYPYPSDLVYDLPGMVRPINPSKPRGEWIKDFLYNKLLYVPVYTTNMVAKINCLDSQRKYKEQPFCIALEINYKQEGGFLTDQMDDIHNDGLAGIHRTKAVFNAIPDAPNKCAGCFFSSNGYDTYKLADIYFPPSGKPLFQGKRDTDDKRGDWSYLTSPNINFHWITTDEPVNLINDFLKSKNLRNTSRFRPHPDGTNDEVDPHANENKSNSARTALASSASIASNITGVYPNPTHGTLNVNLTLPQAGQVLFRLTDSRGRTVLAQELFMPAGVRQAVLPNLRSSGVKPGLYLLQVVAPAVAPQSYKVQVD